MKKTVPVALLCATVLLLGALAWLRIGSVGPSELLADEARAGTLALDFYSQHHAPADSLSNVRLVSEKRITGSSDRAVWEIRIDGGVTEPGSTITYLSTMVLDADVNSGVVTLVAAG